MVMKMIQAIVSTAIKTGRPRGVTRRNTTSAATAAIVKKGGSWWLGTTAAKSATTIAISATRCHAALGALDALAGSARASQGPRQPGRYAIHAASGPRWKRGHAFVAGPPGPAGVLNHCRSTPTM